MVSSVRLPETSSKFSESSHWSNSLPSAGVFAVRVTSVPASAVVLAGVPLVTVRVYSGFGASL